eukprot:TRINITY_DN106385_c0_g1_i1.p1 TRINITY_DN106385_c0_g1~~TRINITY_DN106385_c0_g1_i1.p1  ORF type:complete len:386 (-),score=54.18 TRINITY_DN106385_c0_g1_i1:65-1222(-)
MPALQRRRSITNILFRQTQQRGDEDTAIDASWGCSGSWLVTGHLPRGRPPVQERPFSVRDLSLKPEGGGEASNLLKQRGAGVINMKGCKGEADKSFGQDNFCVAALDGDWEAFCVFDGHGREGHWPATRCAHALPAYLNDSKAKAFLGQGDAKSALEYAFVETEAHIRNQARRSDIDLTYNGATAAVVLYHPRRDAVWVATLGDSRVILVVPGVGAAYQTVDQKPSDPAEARRVEKAGGDIRSEDFGDFIATRIYRPGEEIPGLSVTRSFGDLGLKNFGVIAKPVVAEWSLQGTPNPMVLLASDGVWEFLSSEDAAEIVLNKIAEGPAAAVSELRNTSQDRWEQDDAMYCDDITAVLVPLGKNIAPRLQQTTVCFAGVCSACSLM